MRIRPADTRDLDAVAQSYRDLLMHEMDQPGYSNWKFGVFPTMEISHRAHTRQELYVAEEKGRLIGSMILTPTPALLLISNGLNPPISLQQFPPSRKASANMVLDGWRISGYLSSRVNLS